MSLVGQTRSFGDVGLMSSLPETGQGRGDAALSVVEAVNLLGGGRTSVSVKSTVAVRI